MRQSKHAQLLELARKLEPDDGPRTALLCTTVAIQVAPRLTKIPARAEEFIAIAVDLFETQLRAIFAGIKGDLAKAEALAASCSTRCRMSDTAAPPAEMWARLELMGHRTHYGRISEVEQFGAKQLRIDIPLEDPDKFETRFYGGPAIYGITPVTEDAARVGAARARPTPWQPRDALPAPETIDHADDEEF